MIKINFNYTVVFVLILLAFGNLGCGLKKSASKISTAIFYEGSSAIDEESDVELAEKTMLGSLKTLEIFHRQNPKDKNALLLLTKSYAGYAYGFTENNLLANKNGNTISYQKALNRAQRFYGRAKDYGVQLLKLYMGKSVQGGSFDQFERSLKKFNKKNVEALFWSGFSWGNYINFNKDSVEAIAEAPRVEALMRRVIAIDENYYYGGGHLFMGAFYANRPQMLGGDPKKAKQHFEKAWKISGGNNLMVKVIQAQFYAVQIQDSMLFDQLLREVITTDAAPLAKDLRLNNELAKIRAKTLLRKKSLFFNLGNQEN